MCRGGDNNKPTLSIHSFITREKHRNVQTIISACSVIKK